MPKEVFKALIQGKTETFEVAVTDLEYLRKFDEKIRSINPRILKNLIGWKIIYLMAPNLDTRFTQPFQVTEIDSQL